jgi:hypothetical protein
MIIAAVADHREDRELSALTVVASTLTARTR